MCGDDRVVHSQFFARVFQALGVRLRVNELERIARDQLGILLGPQAVVEQKVESALRAQPEMKIALGADLPVRLQIFLPNDRAAGIALNPQAFGADASLIRRRRLLDPFFLPFEPGHD